MKHKLRYEEQPKTFFIRVITLFFTKSENFTQQVHNIDVFGKYSNYFEKTSVGVNILSPIQRTRRRQIRKPPPSV